MKGLRKVVSCLAASFMVLALVPATVSAAGSERVSTYEELEKAVSKGGIIEVTSAITLESPLQIEKDVTITGDSSIEITEAWDEAQGTPITVSEDAVLTLNGIVLEGKETPLAYGNQMAALLDVKGTLVMEAGSVQNFVNGVKDSSGTNLISVDGGSFVLNGGTIADNRLDSGYYHGIIGLKNGADFTMNGGEISGNYVNDPQGASGVIYVSNAGGENHFVMKDGEVDSNLSCGVYVGSNSSNEQAGGKGAVTFDGGAVRNNSGGKSYYAGGVYIVNGEVVMNGGTIEGNTGLYYGGGVSLVANPAATFIMNGGSIVKNKSMYGAGVFVTGIQNTDWKANVQLNAGLIAENEVSRQGGGIYVVKGQEVQIRNAAVYENEASVIGGGIWTCSTGSLKTYITNGGAVFDNTASGAEDGSAGDDMAFVQHQDSEPEFFLAGRALGGGKIDYYRDGGVYVEEDNGGEGTDGSSKYYLGTADGSARYDANNPGEPVDAVDLMSGSYALKSAISDNAKKLSKEKAQLVITQNKANRGAGIGANGSVIIGDVPQEGVEEYSLNVTKEWALDIPETAKQEIEVALISDGYLLDSLFLNEENGWSASFEGLAEGNYTVKELNVPEGMKSRVSETVLDETAKAYRVTVTNEMSSVSVSGVKVWEDENDKDRIRPESIVINLYADGKKVDSEKVTAAQNWSWSFEGLNSHSNGKEILYTISEEPVKGYTASISGDMKEGFVVTNTHKPSETQTPGDDVDDGKNQNGRTSVRTGDTSSAVHWGIAMILAVCALGMTARVRGRAKK